MSHIMRQWPVFALTLSLIVAAGCGTPGLTNVNGSILISIAVTPEDHSLPAGGSRQFTATGTYSDKTTKDITNLVAWTSSDATKATITAAGLVTAIGKGTATIKATLAYVTGTASLSIVIVPVEAQWARVDMTADGAYSGYSSVATSTDGSVYTAGYLWLSPTTTHDFGNGVITAGTITNSGYSSVLTKYDRSGKALWARTPVAGTAGFGGVTVAADGSVYVVGSAYGTLDFGNGVVTTGSSTYGSDILLVKYNGFGIPQWARTIAARPSGIGDSTAFTSVTVAADGSIYAAGAIGYYYSGATMTVTGTYDFGNGVTVTGPFAGRDNGLLVKYDDSGTPLWARTVVAGSGGSVFNGVTVAADGSVYAAGYLLGTGTYSFGNGMTAAGGLDGRNSLLVKYDSTGAAHWAATVQTIPGTTYGGSGVELSGVSVAPDGSVFVAGSVLSSGYMDFGNNVTVVKNYSPPATDSSAAVLVKYDPSGTAQWARTIASDENIFGVSGFSGVSVASDGSVLTAGTFLGTGTFDYGDGVTAVATDYSRIILVKYSSSGTTQWMNTTAPGTNSSGCYGVSAASDGSVFAAGSVTGPGTFDFGNSITATTGNFVENFFLVKYQ